MITINSLRQFSIVLCLFSTFMVELSPDERGDKLTPKSTTATFQSSEENADPVWPGDFNDNGIADHSDLLIWGLAFGKQIGPTRPYASTNWYPQEGPNWHTRIKGVNKKHQDANGDGLIDLLDVEVLKKNYGRVREMDSLDYKANNATFELESVPDNPQNQYEYELSIDSKGEPVRLHGFSCTFDFGNISIEEAYFDITDSSLDPSEFLQVWDSTASTLDIALTRTDKVNQLCEGPVGTLIIILDDISVFNSDSKLTVNVKNGGQMKASGDFHTITSTTIESYPDALFSSKNRLTTASEIKEDAIKKEIKKEYESPDMESIYSVQIFPNPVFRRAVLSFHTSLTQEVKFWIIDASGKRMVNQELTISKGQNFQELDTSQFEKGMYYLFLQTDQNIQYKKFVVMR